MFIVDYKRSEVINIDRMLRITLSEVEGMIYARNESTIIILGVYEPNNRAKEVFEEMLEKCFPINPLIADDIDNDVLREMPNYIYTETPAKIGTYYYMPKK